MGKNQYGICTSPETAVKQKSLVGILSILMPVAKRNMLKWGDSRFWIYDLNAARSYYPDDNGAEIKSSALYGVELARYFDLDYRAILCEKEPDNAQDLQNYFQKDSRVTVLCGDHSQTLPNVLPSPYGKARFGYVYVDPNDAQLPVNLLAEMFSMHPFSRTDLIVNVAAASTKRMINLERYNDIALDSLLKRVKKKTWLVREPHDIQQWSLLVGTNWAEAPEWKNAGFYRMDTDKGQKVWQQLSKTKKQAKAQVQPPLLTEPMLNI